MIEEKKLKKILLAAISEDKALIGIKNVLKYVKGSKFIILSSSIDQELKKKIINASKATSIPFLEYDGSSFELGRLCDKPFVISAVAIKSTIEPGLLSELSLNI
jgi:large subunit ribosomal protein L30e